MFLIIFLTVAGWGRGFLSRSRSDSATARRGRGLRTNRKFFGLFVFLICQKKKGSERQIVFVLLLNKMFGVRNKGNKKETSVATDRNKNNQLVFAFFCPKTALLQTKKK